MTGFHWWPNLGMWVAYVLACSCNCFPRRVLRLELKLLLIGNRLVSYIIRVFECCDCKRFPDIEMCWSTPPRVSIFIWHCSGITLDSNRGSDWGMKAFPPSNSSFAAVAWDRIMSLRFQITERTMMTKRILRFYCIPSASGCSSLVVWWVLPEPDMI